MAAEDSLNPSSFEAIWGPELAAVGHVMVPKCLAQCPEALGIKGCELSTVIHLLSYHYGHRNPYPSKDTVGKGANKAPGTIQRHVRSLEGQGLIRRVFHDGTSNEYSFDGLREALIVHLETCTRHVQKRIPTLSNNEHPLYPKIDTPPYPKVNTKEDSTKKDKKKKTNELDVAGTPARNATDKWDVIKPEATRPAVERMKGATKPTKVAAPSRPEPIREDMTDQELANRRKKLADMKADFMRKRATREKRQNAI